MALKRVLRRNVLKEMDNCFKGSTRFYSSKLDLKELRPMILQRIQNRAKDYPIPSMVPIAHDVLNARALLFHGVSTLLRVVPVRACKFCPEVYIGEQGHMIKTCCGYRGCSKNRVHEWISGSLNDILVPVEAFHLKKMFQDVIKHKQRFDFDRVPAVVELCCQAGGTDISDMSLNESNWESSGDVEDVKCLSANDLQLIANGTLKAWESLRSGVKKLLLVYPSKVCKYCSEVHIGPSGHKARQCGIFKYQSWRGAHFWKKAEVDDLVPPNIVWHKRPQDPVVLLDEHRNYYGHAPAVVDLCRKAGAVVPAKYNCMMKVDGRPGPP